MTHADGLRVFDSGKVVHIIRELRIQPVQKATTCQSRLLVRDPPPNYAHFTTAIHNSTAAPTDNGIIQAHPSMNRDGLV